MKAWILRILGASGALLFSSLFVFTFDRPEWVEQAGRDFLTAQVEEQVGKQVALSAAEHGGALARAAGELARRNTASIDGLNQALRAKLHERVAAALAEIRHLDCECRARVAQLLQVGMVATIASLEAQDRRLTDFIQGKYLRVAGELTHDLRIFTATNAAACLLLLVLSFARPRAVDHLVIPGVLLAVAVVVSSYCYVFEQNWLFTILYSDYFGFAYLGLLAFVFGLLLDVSLNRARFTTRIGNTLLHVVGSSFSLSPC